MLFHGFHLRPATPACLSLACVDRILHEPLLVRVPILDDAGIPYAFDLATTQGTLVALVALLTLKWVQDWVTDERRR